MRRSQTVTVPGEAAAIATAVQTFLSTDKRVSSVEWAEPERHVTANVRSRIATYGGQLDIRLEQAPNGQVRLDVLSRSGPLWDWGANRRNIEALVTSLSDSGYLGTSEPMVTKVKFGG